MLTLTEIFIIIIIHWFADFIMQDEKWALGKSKNWSDLLSHTITYSLCWFIIVLLFGYSNPNETTNWYVTNTLLFIGITFIAHTITDYFTSRIVSKKFENKQYGSSIPNFGAFTIIGIDQVLHYIQLFSTYYLLKTL
jgi:hypothetical protein